MAEFWRGNIGRFLPISENLWSFCELLLIYAYLPTFVKFGFPPFL